MLTFFPEISGRVMYVSWNIFRNGSLKVVFFPLLNFTILSFWKERKTSAATRKTNFIQDTYKTFKVFIHDLYKTHAYIQIQNISNSK